MKNFQSYTHAARKSPGILAAVVLVMPLFVERAAANIREQVTVDRSGNNYEGTFALVQYEPDGITVLATITGTVTATRITAD